MLLRWEEALWDSAPASPSFVRTCISGAVAVIPTAGLGALVAALLGQVVIGIAVGLGYVGLGIVSLVLVLKRGAGAT